MSLRPVAGAFVLLGVYWGAWAVAAADIERSLGLSHAAFGLLLAAALIGASAINAAGGALAERWGARRALRRSLVAWGALLWGAAALQPAAAFAVALAAVVSIAGLVDVVMNIIATAVFTDRPGHLVRFHGLFNLGGAGGALLAGLLLRGGLSWRWAWLVAGAIAFVLAAVTHPGPDDPAPVEGSQSLAAALHAVRVEGLVLLSLAFAVGAMVEGGISTWGVLYLREQLGAGVLLGTAASIAGYLVAGLARVGLGPLAGAAGAARGVTVGAGLAAAGLVVLAAASTPVVAAAGLVAAAMGISMCWPLLLARATEGQQRPGLVVAGVSAVGYLGLVLGPALVGGLASAVGLRGGLLVLAGASLFVIGAANRPHRVKAR
jgi:MFS family permease